MAVLSRSNWLSQQRVDTSDFLATDSYVAFDFRSLITNFTGSNQAYVIRGFRVVGKSGLSINISVANSLVFNPQDENGSFYAGLSDDPEEIVELPANQVNIFVEAKFANQTQGSATRGFWDPLALSGDDASGTEFSAAVDVQEVIVLEISVNTIGFSEGAIPLLRASTSASAITSMIDCRNLLYRLGKGGTNPDPLSKYDFSSTRIESVPSGTGVGDASDSPWREKDSSGALNDKAFASFKDWADAVMTRISEVSGSSLWYSSGSSVSPVSGLSLNQLYFDTIGHHLQPSSQNAFKWKRVSGTLRLAGEGTIAQVLGTFHEGLLGWQSNNSNLKWYLGATFANINYRNYSDIRFTSPAPADGGNIYLLLEREVSKGSGASVNWGSNGGAPFTASKSVSGLAGDFTGIALGDYIRKESEGYSKYYKVVKFWDGTTVYDNTVASQENFIADGTIFALELESILDPSTTNIAISTEPLKFFRSRYSDADIVADTSVGVYQYQTSNHYWLGRRVGNLFILRGYGTMQEGEEVTALDATFAEGNKANGTLIIEQADNAVYDPSNGYSLKVGSGTLLTIRRYIDNNTVENPTAGVDNSGAMLEYTIDAPVGLIPVGSSLWVRLSESAGGLLTNAPVTNSTDDLDNTDVNTNRWEVLSAADTPARSFDDRNVFWIAKRIVVGGNPVLLFFDGSVLNDFGEFINNSLHVKEELMVDSTVYVNLHTQYKNYPTLTAPSILPPTGSLNIFTRDDLVYQQDYNGDIKLLTNVEGNVYEEIVDVVSAPSTNNEMSPVTTPPTVKTLPQDRKALVGYNVQAATTNLSSTVTITKTSHGLSTGNLITVVTTNSIGGISAANLSVTNASITVLTADTFTYTAGAAASSTATGALDWVTVIKTRFYIVGSQELKVYLNNALQIRGRDYDEVGTLNTPSNNITWLRDVVLGDVVTYRIDVTGGQHIINQNGGITLQSAYNAGNTINVVTGTPIVINGTSGKLLQINGDIEVTGVIDPKGITFTQESSNPLPAGSYGLWFNGSGELMIKRGDLLPEINISNSIISGVSSPANFVELINNTGSTVTKGSPVSVNSFGEISIINVSNEASAFASIGVMENDTIYTASGNVITSGILTNISTSANFGDMLFVSKSGALTNIKPSVGVDGFVSGDWIVMIGVVAKNKNNPLNKDLIVNVQVIGTV